MQTIQSTQQHNNEMLKQSKQNSPMLTELMIYEMLYKRFGGISTTIGSLIVSYLSDVIHYEQFTLRDYQLTTQTMILEISGVKFNDFRVDVDSISKNLNVLINTPQSNYIIGKIKQIKSKRFDIQIDGKTITTLQTPFSKHNEMNSSIEFVYASKKTSGKDYQLRLFRNGMLQIPGVTEQYELSEIKTIVNCLIYLYKQLFETREDVQCINKQIAMANYLTRIDLPKGKRLDLVRASIDTQAQSKEIFSELCKREGVECIHFGVAIRRVVLYVKFAIQKQQNIFTHYNPLSTSNRKQFKSITFQITQRGIVIIQGSTGHFPTMNRIILSFQRIANDYFPQYIR